MLSVYRSLVLCCALWLAGLSGALASTMDDLVRMADQFDQLDKAEFDGLLGKVDRCTAQRDFACAEARLTEAGKLAHGGIDRSALATARQRLDDQRALAQREETERQAALERERREAEVAELRRVRTQECESQCADSGQLQLCYMGQIRPHQCDGGGGVNYGAAVLAGVNSALAGKARIDAIHNRSMAQMQAAQAERARQEQVQRQRVQEEARAAEARRAAQQAERSRAAAPAGAAGRGPEALSQNTLAQIGARQAGVNLAALDGSAGQAGPDARTKEAEQQQAQRRERERKERLDKERAELQAQREAEKAAQAQAKGDYLARVRSGTRLMARQCFGGQYIVGTRPRFSPETVACVDVHYRAQCPGSVSAPFVDGVGKNFVGMGTDCFSGDTYALEPRLSCDVKDIQVTLKEVRACGE